MIPSIPLRIELILAKEPQALHPGLLSWIVFSAAVTGTTITKSSTKTAARPITLFPIIPLFPFSQ